jgi:hypothetical protein
MDVETLPKAVREGYAPAPFFIRQEYEAGSIRWVAWTNSLPDLKSLFYHILDAFPETVEVLLKIKQPGADGVAADSWRRFHATCPVEEFAAAVRENETFAFQDGSSQLCAMCGGGGDYFALDDHGIFFLYADNEGVGKLLQRKGFEERTEELLSDAPHWHVGSSQAQEQRERFIARLGLKSVEPDRK